MTGAASARPARLVGSAGAARTARAAAMSLFQRVRSRWQSSLQLRVVSTTLVVSALVVSVLGFFLMQQISLNLEQHAEASAFTQASDGLAVAQTEPGVQAQPGRSACLLLKQIAQRLKPSDVSVGADYGVGVTLTLPRQYTGTPPFCQAAVDNLPKTLPAALTA